MHRHRDYLIAILLLACTTLCGCTTARGETDIFAQHDSLEPVNKPIFSFNLFVDKFLLRPITKTYQLLPLVVRVAADNFFTNLAEPLNFVEGTLQANPEIAAKSFSRFVLNTTVGVGGLYDYAAAQGIEFQDQSGGKTLAAWGVPSGSYFVIPLLGPSTVRGAVGEAADWFLDPLGYLLNTDEQIVQVAGDTLTTGDELRSSLDELYYKSLSPYAATRAAFMQHEGLVSPTEIPEY